MNKSLEIRKLLEQLEAGGVRYCHWKSNIRLAKSLAAETDLDLLVSAENKPLFDETIQHAGCRKMRNHSLDTFPCVEDYFLADGDGKKTYHLHVHTKVIFGHKHLKEYQPPLETECLKVRNNKANVKVPTPECELLIHILRMAVKTFSPIRLLFPRCIPAPNRYPSKADMEELNYLQTASEPKIFGAFVSGLPFKIDKEAIIRIGMGEKERLNIILWRIARSMRHYKRLSFATILWRLVKANLMRVLQKICFRKPQNKKYLANGFTVAIVGADGAGKTTVLQKVEEFFNARIYVERFYLGSNRPGVSSRFFRITTLPIKSVSIRLGRFLKSAIKIADAIVLFQEWFYLRKRKKRFRKAREMAKEGKLVFLERFPVPGIQDAGYEIINRSYKGFLDKLRHQILSEYNNFTGADVVIFLSIDPQNAIKRKPDHDIEEVKRKAEEMEKQWQKIGASRHVKIDASQPLEEVVAKTINAVWDTRL